MYIDILLKAETDLMKKSEELDEINRKYEQSNSYLEETKQELANNLSRLAPFNFA